MPPRLASILTLAFVFYLFRRDSRERPNVTRALWIPTVWVLIITTRAVTTWLGMFGISAGGISVEEGSTIDALVYFTLIAAGLRVLMQRRVSLAEVVRSNQWLCLYLLYCFLAIVWSDFPFVAFKRWAKDLGHPIMALVLLTEPNFEDAFTTLWKRCGYVIVPVSILFIKYYPEWGRGFSPWTGQGYNTGITGGKNALGHDCLILGYFFVWYLLMTLRREKSKARRNELILSVGFLVMIGWLLSIADSKTPLISLVLALAILLFTGLRWVDKRRIGIYLLSVIVVLGAAEATFGVYETTLDLLGRNASLTGRAPLWAELRTWGDENPILGIGFESFWLGERRERLWEIFTWRPTQAHNGYLETYLNLGLVGLLLLLFLIAATYRRSRQMLLRDICLGRFRFPFFFAILIYNWTEASLYGLHPIFFMFILITMEYPKLKECRREHSRNQFHEGMGMAESLARV